VALTFDRSLEVRYRIVDEVLPGIRRVVAENPGPYTFKGTATFIVGHGDVTIIDPGPNDERHLDAVHEALRGETIERILVTHTHPDHSPGVAGLVQRRAAPVFGYGPHPVASEAEEAAYGEAAPESPAAADAAPAPSPSPSAAPSKEPRPATDRSPGDSEAHGDRAFAPTDPVRHGQRIEGSTMFEAVHTPGHLANHVCFALPNTKVLFTGDHVMGWSTSVISPPGGDLTDYLASLRLLLTRDDEVYVPTHGSPITDPKSYVRGLIAHREERTAQIIDRLRSGPHRVPELVAALYVGLDERLVRAAGRSVLAHLDALRRAGSVAGSGAEWADDDPADQTPWIARTYRLA
jgi:glyoxylase-like metal-dependent hydrolase (beta-lactamase superfamily II)